MDLNIELDKLPIFPIVSLKSDERTFLLSKINKSEIRFCGNGFFISDNGVFATVAHVLKDNRNVKTNDYILYDDRLFKIENPTRLLTDTTFDHKDVAVGRINITTPNHLNPNIFSTININENIIIRGFSNKLLPEENEKQYVFKKNYNFFNFNAQCCSLKYFNSEIKIEMKNFYSIKHDALKGCRKGLSGSPVFNKENKVVGVFKGGGNFEEFRPIKGQVLYMNHIKNLFEFYHE